LSLVTSKDEDFNYSATVVKHKVKSLAPPYSIVLLRSEACESREEALQSLLELTEVRVHERLESYGTGIGLKKGIEQADTDAGDGCSTKHPEKEDEEGWTELHETNH